MTLFGETILLAENEYPPNILAHMKKLHTAVKDGLVVKVYYNKGKKPRVDHFEFENPILVEVLDCLYDKDFISFETIILPGQEDENEELSINTSSDIIVEVEPVDGEVTPTSRFFGYTTPAEQDDIIGKIRQDPELLEKVPPSLWRDELFKMKFLRAKLKVPGKYIPDHIKTLAKMEKVNYFGRQTRNIRIPKLPDELDRVGDYLGVRKTPNDHFAKVVNESDRRQGRPPSCKESNCSIQGGRRTRRFKK